MTKKILFVDDDPVCHFIHQKIVEHLKIDCDVRTACNGEDALDMVSSDQSTPFVPDYIFVDLNMPIMDGFGFIQNLQACNRPELENISIIVLTSSLSAEDRVRALELGVSDYVVKPIKWRDLLRIVQSEPS
jgi:CheY-like chemotaxis protein